MRTVTTRSLYDETDIVLIYGGVNKREPLRSPPLNACFAMRTAENCVFCDFVLDSNRVLLTIAPGGAPSPEVNRRNFYRKALYHDSGNEAPLFSCFGSGRVPIFARLI